MISSFRCQVATLDKGQDLIDLSGMAKKSVEKIPVLSRLTPATLRALDTWCARAGITSRPKGISAILERVLLNVAIPQMPATASRPAPQKQPVKKARKQASPGQAKRGRPRKIVAPPQEATELVQNDTWDLPMPSI